MDPDTILPQDVLGFVMMRLPARVLHRVRGVGCLWNSTATQILQQGKASMKWSALREIRCIHVDQLVGVEFSPNNETMATVSLDGTTRIWCTGSWAQKDVLTGHRSGVTGCVFMPSGRSLVTTSLDGTAQRWSLAAQSSSPCRHCSGQAPVSNLQLIPPGRVARGLDRAMSIDPDTGTNSVQPHCVCASSNQMGFRHFTGSRIPVSWMREDFRASHTDEVTSCAVIPNGSVMVTTSRDNRVYVWDPRQGALLLRTISGHTHEALCSAFSPDGKWLVTGSRDCTAIVWQTSDWGLVQSLEGHRGDVSAVMFSPDSSTIVTASRDSTARVWKRVCSECFGGNGETWSHIHTITGHTKAVRCGAFSPDGEILLTGSQDETAQLWSTADWSHVYTIKDNMDVITACAFSCNGTSLATTCWDRSLRIYALR